MIRLLSILFDPKCVQTCHIFVLVLAFPAFLLGVNDQLLKTKLTRSVDCPIVSVFPIYVNEEQCSPMAEILNVV